MKIIFIFFIGLFSIFFSFQNTLGCQCSAVGPICSQFSRADAVFVGRVEKVDLPNSPKELSSYSMIHFNVEQSFKGITETTVKVGYEFGTSCSKSPDAFKPGEKWLVYGYKDEELLIIPFCTGSHQISSRRDDLEFIENLLKGKTKEFVFGRLVKDRYDEIKNAYVIVKRKNKTYKTRMYKYGFFAAQVPSEGIYRVKVTVPFKAEKPSYPYKFFKRFSTTKNKTLVEYETKVDKGLCSFEELNFYEEIYQLSELKWHYQFLIK